MSGAVLISHAVAEGKEAEFRAWQQEISEAARLAPGYDGTELMPPVPDLQPEWLLLLRFKSGPQLQDWLASPVRASLLEKAQGLFAGETREIVMMAPHTHSSGPVSAMISCRVPPGSEEKFRAWQARLEEEERRFPGYLGTEVFAPRQGVTQDWSVLFRFDSDEHLEAWLQSEPRQRLLRETEEAFRHFDLRKVGSSFAGWFPSSDSPPDWKQAMVVLLGIYPIVALITLYLLPLEKGLPLAVGVFLNNTISTIVLTWPTIMLLNKAFAWWLYPKKPGTAVPGVLAVGLCYALLVGFFLWLSRG